MADKAWSLSNEQRAETVSRVGQNIESLAFSRGIEINDAEAHSIATTVEKKAYTTASVEATTTTGFRPHDEVLKSYARCGNILLSRQLINRNLYGASPDLP